MADFEVVKHDGVNYIKATLRNEEIRAEAGAFCYSRGKIVIDSPFPTIRGWICSALAEESVFRPSYTGTGEVYLESSLGGFEILELREGESWILQSGIYWASDGSVKLGLHREPFLSSFWAGEGFIDLQTKVTGPGKVVMHSIGQVDTLELHDEMVVTEGKYVIARSEGLRYRAQRATKSLLGMWTSGERGVRVYEGTGKVLLCSVPYWRYRIAQHRGERVVGV